jgi:hypothetical protein
MRRERIEYGRMVESALRTVVRDVLLRLVEDGVGPPHHFYITFRTGAPGVEIAEFLRDRYPQDMTIVLQHQYWDLEVDDLGFSVTLSFNDTMQRLRIPFTALKVFADPGVEFGLQFTIEDDQPDQPAPAEPSRLLAGPPRPVDTSPGDAHDGQGGAEIVTLDRFRKK